MDKEMSTYDISVTGGWPDEIIISWLHEAEISDLN